MPHFVCSEGFKRKKGYSGKKTKKALHRQTIVFVKSTKLRYNVSYI